MRIKGYIQSIDVNFMDSSGVTVTSFPSDATLVLKITEGDISALTEHMAERGEIDLELSDKGAEHGLFGKCRMIEVGDYEV